MMTLKKAIAEVKREGLGYHWPVVGDASRAILKAAISGDLIPKADHEMAIALAYQRAADVDLQVGGSADGQGNFYYVHGEKGRKILALAPAEALAEVQALKAEAENGWVAAAKENDLHLTALVRAEAAEAEVEKLKAERDELKRLLDFSTGIVGVNHKRAKAAEAEVARLQSMIVRYRDHVGYYEGTDYLDDCSSPYLTDDECKELLAINVATPEKDTP